METKGKVTPTVEAIELPQPPAAITTKSAAITPVDVLTPVTFDPTVSMPVTVVLPINVAPFDCARSPWAWAPLSALPTPSPVVWNPPMKFVGSNSGFKFAHSSGDNISALNPQEAANSVRRTK